MAHIEFVDETFRDGQQSLWGMRMQAGMAIPIASTLDRTGFRRIEFGGSNYFEVMVRYCQEDPWAGMDAVLEQMPRTVIRSGMRSNAMATFRTSPDALMDAWMRRNCVHGVRSMWVYDLLYNIDKMTRLAKVAKEIPQHILSNAMNAQIMSNVEKLGAPFYKVITAEQTGSYKPQMNGFEYMFDVLGCGPEDITHVSSSFRYDLMTAYDLGIKSKVWVNRRHEPANPFYEYTEISDVSKLPAVFGF